jgi:hypothetical protein
MITITDKIHYKTQREVENRNDELHKKEKENNELKQ